MRIVVIGATGNVGTALLRRLQLAEEVTSVLGISRRGPDRAGDPFDGVPFVRCDIGADGSRAQLIEAFTGADAVVHLAWIIRPNRDLGLLRRVNVDGARRVAEAAVEAGVGHLVVASSVGAYGSDADPSPGDAPHDESFPTQGTPTSHYAAQKAEVERMLDELEREHPELPVTRLRPGLIFQEEAGPEIRDYFLGRLVPRPVLGLLARGVLPLLPWPEGVVCQAVHADDVADAYVRVIRARATGAYNAAADPVVGPDLMGMALGAPRWLPLNVAVVRALVAVSYRLRIQPTDPGWIDMAVRTPVVDTTRLREDTGWRPRHDTLDTMRAVVQARGSKSGDGMGDGMEHSGSPMVLVTGASGYVGGRLIPELLAAGASVRAGGRSPEKMTDRSWARDDSVQLAEVDLAERMQVRRALDGVDAVVFLVHAMGGGSGYADREARMARIMAEEAERAGTGRIVYLSGLHPDLPIDELSEHMASRERVAQILSSCSVPTVVLQAATVIGGGSASFEIIRHLSDRLSFMPAPRWVHNRIEPVAIADVLHYLVAAVMAPEPIDGAFALASGESKLRFADLLTQYADEAGRRPRRVVALPVPAPLLSGLWIGLVTPVPRSIAIPLAQSMQHEAISHGRTIDEILPEPAGGATPYREAVRAVLEAEGGSRESEEGDPAGTWPTDPLWAGPR